MNITSLYGGYDTLFKTFLVFIIVDYISGLLKAIVKRKVNSDIGVKGIVKKFGYILIVVIATSLDNLFGNNMAIRTPIIYMFIANEGISILENMALVGVPIPKILKDKLENLGGDNNE